MFIGKKTFFKFSKKKLLKFCLNSFSIVNLIKSDSLYNEGMRPLMYSTTEAKNKQIGWRRCGDNIIYFKNDDNL